MRRPGQHVLIVDDYFRQWHIIDHVLRCAGYRVTRARDLRDLNEAMAAPATSAPPADRAHQRTLGRRDAERRRARERVASLGASDAQWVEMSYDHLGFAELEWTYAEAARYLAARG